MSPPLLLLPSFIPLDVWAEVALQMLDACDLMYLYAAALLPPPLPAGAAFVAKRVLSKAELQWFAARAIPVQLLREVVHQVGGHKTIWRMNGVAHRDDDLPAVEVDNGDRAWFVHGEVHRDGDRPAVVWLCNYGNVREEWWQHNKRHRDGGLPAVIESMTGHTHREWWVNGERKRRHELIPRQVHQQQQ